METHLNRRNESGNGKSLNWGALGRFGALWSAIGALLGRYWGAIGALLGHYWGAIGALLGHYWGAIGCRRYILSVGVPQKSTGGTMSCSAHSIGNYILSIRPSPYNKETVGQNVLSSDMIETI